jgi:lysine-N-methylase
MRKTKMVRPQYAERFVCIGAHCEDTCCNGWLVTLDVDSFRKCSDLPAAALRSIAEASLQRVANADGETHNPAHFGEIRMLPSGDCPFLSEEHLCRIQRECGEAYLSELCTTFPRICHIIDGLTDTELSLSCPEAARLVLLDRSLLTPVTASGYELTWDESATGQPLRSYFWQIRGFVTDLIRSRTYSLWQRLLLVGLFCRRMESLLAGESEREFPALLDDFSGAVGSRGLSAAMEAIPADLPLQLELVLRLIAQRVNGKTIRPRLRAVLDAFVEGIGHSREASIESQAARYAAAYAQYYAPFFSRRPHILENYLLNIVLRDRFPFGPALGDPDARPEPMRAFATLALQFALVKGCRIPWAALFRGRRSQNGRGRFPAF